MLNLHLAKWPFFKFVKCKCSKDIYFLKYEIFMLQKICYFTELQIPTMVFSHCQIWYLRPCQVLPHPQRSGLHTCTSWQWQQRWRNQLTWVRSEGRSNIPGSHRWFHLETIQHLQKMYTKLALSCSISFRVAAGEGTQIFIFGMCPFRRRFPMQWNSSQGGSNLTLFWIEPYIDTSKHSIYLKTWC